MKILLVSEYSRLHNSLKEGLIASGQDVTIIGGGDGFKKYPVDIKIEKKYDTGISKKVKVLLYKLFGIDISSESVKRQFFAKKEQLRGFDVVQLINESPFGATAKIEKEIFSFLKKNNSKIFLLSCGTDYVSVKYAFDKKIRYSILTPFFEKRISSKQCSSALKYLRNEFKEYHEFLYENINGVIATDFDYHIPLQGNLQYLGLIPNPINTDKLFLDLASPKDKIVIFHGINRSNYIKKGNDFFESALKKIQEKYSEKIEIITVENIPYKEYIDLYSQAHILLDQVYSFDQGYNALEAMAKGKVVFTGAETEFLKHYNLKQDEVCINALPDVESLVSKLSWLIENPEKIKEISKNTRSFIEEEHNYISIAKKYLEVWEKN